MKYTNATSPPPIITYQGKLLNNNSTVSSATNMGFLIYDAATSGNVVYTAAGTISFPSTISVTPSSGIFAVDLGGSSTNALATSTFTNYHTLYLEVQVAGTTLSPRRQITSAPYAVNTEYLMGLSATSTSSSEYIPIADANGNFLFTGNARSAAVSGGLVYINPTSSQENYSLFGVAKGGAQRFRVDAEGDTWIKSVIYASSLLTVDGGITPKSLTNPIKPNANDAYNLGSFGYAWRYLFASGSLTDTGLKFGSFSPGFFSGGVSSTGNINPTTTNKYNFGRFNIFTSIGSPRQSGWRDVYASGTIYIGGATTSAGVYPTDNNAYDFGGYGAGWRVFGVSGTAYVGGVSTSGKLLPTRHNVFDMSGYDLAWNEFFTSGTAFIGGVSSTSGLYPAENYAYDLGDHGRVWRQMFASGTAYLGGLSTTVWFAPLNGNNTDDLGSGLAWRNLFASSTAFIGGVSSTSGLYPAGNNTYDLGFYGLAWKQLFVSGTAYLGASTTAGVTPLTNAQTDVGGFGSAWRQLFVSGTAFIGGVSSTSGLYPVANNSYDLGDFGRAWRNLYVSGTAYFSNFVTSGLTTPNSHNTTNLGVFGTAWNEVYVSGTAFIGGVSSTSGLYPAANNSYDLGDAGRSWQNLFVSGTAYLSNFSTTTLRRPNAHNTTNLGIFGTAWNELYVSNTVFMNGVSSTSGLYPTENTASDLGGFDSSWNDIFVSSTVYFSNFSTSTLNNPNAHNTTDLGTYTSAWRSIFASGTAYLNNVSTSAGIYPTADNAIDLGGYSRSWNELFASGTAFIGGASSTSGLYPTANNLYDIGDYTRAWRNVFASGTSYLGNVSTSAGIYPTNNNLYDLGGFSRSWNELYTSGTAFIGGASSTSGLYPTIHNSYDVGGYTQAWRDIFVSGTAFIGGVSSSAGLYPTVNNSYDLGSFNLNWRNIYASGTAFAANVGLNTSTLTGAFALSSGTYGGAFLAGTTTFGDTVQIQGKATSMSAFSSTAFASSATDMVTQGDYVYAADGDFNGTIGVFDISDPAAPKQLVAMGPRGTDIDGNPIGATDGDAYIIVDIFVRGRYLYAYISELDASGDLAVIDIHKPKQPVLVGFISKNSNLGAFGAGGGLWVDGSYAYLASGLDDTFSVVNVSNPRNPAVVTSILNGTHGALLDGAKDVVVANGFAYVISQYSDALQIIDVSDPARPIVRGSVTDATNLNGPSALTIRGKYAYIANNEALNIAVVDVSNPDGPVYVSSVSVNFPITMFPLSMIMSGNYLYVGGFNAGNSELAVVDVTSSTNPIVSRRDTFAGNIEAQAIQGNYHYLFDGTNMRIYDITGAKMSNADIGSVKINTVLVDTASTFYGSANLMSGAAFDGNVSVLGDVSFTTPSSTRDDSSAYAINTLRFSHRALFIASTTNSFIFDTTSTIASSTSNYIVSVRDNLTGQVFSIATNGDVNVNNKFSAAVVTIGTPGNPGDLAEQVDINPDDKVEPGDVLTIDQEQSDTYRKSTTTYDNKVAGVVSTNPTITVGYGKTTSTAVMAMLGRVPVKVTGLVRRGDLLVASDKPGHAMVYDEKGNLRHGSTVPSRSPRCDVTRTELRSNDGKWEMGNGLTAVIGTALEEFVPGVGEATEGKVLALLRIGLVGGGSALQGNRAMNFTAEILAVRDAVFAGSIAVKGHAGFGKDTVGRARIGAGSISVNVLFEKEYETQPIVIATPREAVPNMLPEYHVESDINGFTIIIDQALSFDLEFNWQAFGMYSDADSFVISTEANPARAG